MAISVVPEHGNPYLLTFVAIKIDLRIVGSPRLFLLIPMDLKKYPEQILNYKVNSKFFHALQVGLSCSSKSFVFPCNFCWILIRLFINLRKLIKIATSARLWSPKSIGSVCEYTKHFFGKLRINTTQQKLILW